jgi:hypothetical protein
MKDYINCYGGQEAEQNMKRNVLLIARRSAKPEALLRYWPNDKWDLYLYTDRKDEWYPGMSEQFGEKWLSHLPGRNHGAVSSDLIGNTKKHPTFGNALKTKKKQLRKYVLLNLLRVYDRHFWTWTLPSFSNLTSIIEKTRPDVVISVYGPFAASLIAQRIALRHGIPWIAYFRDHCTTFDQTVRVPIVWHLQSVIDRRVHAPASCLVGVSAQFVDILSSFYGIPRYRSRVITGCFDDRHLPEDIRERCVQRRKKQLLPAGKGSGQPTCLKISYAGKLYKHRVESLYLLLNAVKVMLNQGVPCELEITVSNAFHYLPQKLKEMIDQLKSRGLIVTLRSEGVPYAEALRMTDSADVNIILEGMRPPQSTAGTLTLKIFDMMMVAKPTIAISSPSLPIGDYLRETGIGIDCKDTESIAAALNEIWKWKQGGSIPNWYSPVAGAIEQYSSRSMAEKLSELSEKVYNRSLMDN